MSNRMRWFAIQDARGEGSVFADAEITVLHDLLAQLRNAWRDPPDGNPLIYSVEVMTLFGAVIAEIERLGPPLFAWEEDEQSEQRFSIGDLVCNRDMFREINPPLVGRIVQYLGRFSVGVLWKHATFPQVEDIRDLVKVGEEYERFAPRNPDADCPLE